jgi:hypothetical protein
VATRRALAAAWRAAGVHADAVRAFSQRGRPMPLGTGDEAEAAWSAWKDELSHASAAGDLSPHEAKRSTWTNELLRMVSCVADAPCFASSASVLSDCVRACLSICGLRLQL